MNKFRSIIKIRTDISSAFYTTCLDRRQTDAVIVVTEMSSPTVTAIRYLQEPHQSARS